MYIYRSVARAAVARVPGKGCCDINTNASRVPATYTYISHTCSYISHTRSYISAVGFVYDGEWAGIYM